MDMQYSSKFSSRDYTQKITSSGTVPNKYTDFLVTELVKFCQQTNFSKRNVKLLDYGCGPTPIFSAALSSISKEITLAEYEECHRDYLEKWLRKSDDSCDWSSNMKRVAGLYGGMEWELFEEELREKITGVVSCDITKEELIAEGREGPYEIVLSSLCLENPSLNVPEYRELMKKMVSLVKENGYFLLLSAIRENSDVGFYQVNNHILRNLALKRMDVVEALQYCGLQILKEETLILQPSMQCNTEKMIFFIAQKLQ